MPPLWEVIDHNGDTVFDAESVASEPIVRAGFMPAREWARRLARENTDPDAPAPLIARKLA